MMQRATTLDASLRNKKGGTKLRPVHRTSDGKYTIYFENNVEEMRIHLNFSSPYFLSFNFYFFLHFYKFFN